MDGHVWPALVRIASPQRLEAGGKPVGDGHQGAYPACAPTIKTPEQTIGACWILDIHPRAINDVIGWGFHCHFLHREGIAQFDGAIGLEVKGGIRGI